MNKISFKNNLFIIITFLFLFSIFLEKIFIPSLPLHLNIIYVFSLLMISVFFRDNFIAYLKSPFCKYLIYIFVYCLISTIYFHFQTPNEVFDRLPKQYGLRGSSLRGIYIIFQNILLISVAYTAYRCFKFINLKSLKKIIIINSIILILLFSYEFFGRNFFSAEIYYLRSEGWLYQSASRSSNFFRLWATFDEPGTLGKFCATIFYFIYAFSVFVGLEKINKNFLLFSLLTVMSVFGVIFSFSLSSIISLVFSVFFLFLYVFLKEKKHKKINYIKSTIFFAAPLLLLNFLISSEIFITKISNTFNLQTYTETKSSTSSEMIKSKTYFDADSVLKLKKSFDVKKIDGRIQFVNIPKVREIPSSNMRITGQLLTVNQILKTPLFGVGFGNMPFYTYMPEASIFSFGSFNTILAYILELGIVGSILVFNIFYKIFMLKKENSGNVNLFNTLKFTLMFSLINDVIYGCYGFTVIDMILVGSIFAVSKRAN